MQNKPIKTIILLIYSWLIYNIFIFLIAPFIIYWDNLYNYLTIMGDFLFAILFFKCFFDWLGFIFFTEPGILFASCFFPINGLAWFLWLKKQTILRGWFLAFAGICAGPGVIFFIELPRFKEAPHIHFYMPIFINALFFLLWLGDRLQKKYWPNNKLANRIRYILKWPCTRA